MTSVDASEVRAFAATLRDAGRVERDTRQVVSKGALNIKNEMQAEVRESRHFSGRGVAESITYDMTGNAFYSEAVIGPRKPGPGALLNIAYFGTSRGGGTVADPSKALAAEAPQFEKALADLAERALR